jgi:hypothetical protein
VDDGGLGSAGGLQSSPSTFREVVDDGGLGSAGGLQSSPSTFRAVVDDRGLGSAGGLQSSPSTFRAVVDDGGHGSAGGLQSSHCHHQAGEESRVLKRKNPKRRGSAHLHLAALILLTAPLPFSLHEPNRH